jgi:hypothetical protein
VADVRQDEVIVAHNAFAAIELRGVVYFIQSGAAKDIQKQLNEQIIWNPFPDRITEFLTGVSEFVVDVDNGEVVKPKPVG